MDVFLRSNLAVDGRHMLENARVVDMIVAFILEVTIRVIYEQVLSFVSDPK